MKKIAKIIAITAGALAGLLVAVFVALKMISDERYREWITSAAQTALGRDVSIADLDIDLNTSLRLVARDVRMANAEWGSRPDMLIVGEMEAEVNLIALLGGVAEVRAVVKRAEVMAEANAEGAMNWALGSGAPAGAGDSDTDSDGAALPLRPLIRELRIEDLTLTLVRRPGAPARTALVENFLVETPQNETTLFLSARFEEIPVELKGDLGPLSEVLDRTSSPLKLAGALGDTSLTVSGTWGPLLPDPNMAVTLYVHIPSTAHMLSLAEIELEKLGVTDIHLDIAATDGHFSIARILTNLDGDIVSLSAEGSVSDLMKLEGIDVAAQARSGALNQLINNLNLQLPLELPPEIEVSAKIRGNLDGLGVEEFTAAVNEEGLELTVSGSVGNALTAERIDAVVTLKATSTAAFSKLAGLDLPDLGVLDVSANVASEGKAIKVAELDASLRSDDIDLTLAGSVADVVSLSGIDVKLDAEVDSLSARAVTEIEAMLDRLEVDIPLDLLPQSLKLKARAVGDREKLSVDDIDGEARYEGILATLSGAVADVRPADLKATSGINVKLNAAISSLDALSELAKTKLPATDPIEIDATVSDRHDGGKRSVGASVILKSGGVNLDLEGLLPDLTSLDNLDLSILLEANSLGDFNELAGRELPEKGPVRLTGTAKVRPNAYTLDDFHLTLDDQAAEGFVGIELAASDAGKHTLSGELNIPYLDLSPLLPEARDERAAPDQMGSPTFEQPATKDVKEDQEVAEADAAIQETTERLFSTDPLPLEQLRKINADLHVTAQRLVLGKAELRDLEVAASLEDGLLSVDPIESSTGSGTLDGRFQLDGRGDVAKLRLEIVIEDLPMPMLGGGLDSEINLDGDGASVADLMGGLDGRLMLVVRDGAIPRSYVTDFGSGLFSFSAGKDETGLECGILRMDIEDGKVDFDDKLAVQLTDVTWRGGGNINLKTEKIGIGIAPKPRKGVSIGAGALASLVYIGGTLKQPRVQLDPKDVAVQYGKYMAAISTGGVSILAGALLDKFHANRDVCEAILSGTVFDPEAKPDESSDSSAANGAGQERSARTEQRSRGAVADPSKNEPREAQRLPKNLQ